MFIAGNWKLNCTIVQGNKLASTILKNIEGKNLNCEVAIFPPFTCLSSISDVLKNSVISLGGQDCSIHTNGAYTGDIAASMLVDVGCKYVILGHSERRHLFNETDEIIHSKIIQSMENGLIPILCIGEKLSDRESGNTEQVLLKQLKIALKDVNGEYILAYEPVWAIGTGMSATAEMVGKTHTSIRNILLDLNVNNDVPILYGGSVSIKNASELARVSDIDGFLIGGASLDVKNFYSIYLEL